MDNSPFARTLARAAMGVLAESEDPRRHPAPAPDPRATPRIRTALVQLLEADPADLAALETVALSLLDARESLDGRADADHRELEAADPSPSDSGRDGGALNRLLDHHVAFAESSVLLGVTATLLEYCGRQAGWAREWQVEMQPFRVRAESRVGHPGRLGRFAAVARLRKCVPVHLLEVPEKDWDMLFRDAYWGISYAAFRTLENGETWRDFFDVAPLFDRARLARAALLYLQYVMVARSFHWPPDTFAVRLSYLARLTQLARPAVPA